MHWGKLFVGCSCTSTAARGQLLTADRRREEDTWPCYSHCCCWIKLCDLRALRSAANVANRQHESAAGVGGVEGAVRGARSSRGSHLLLLFQGEKRVGKPADRSRWNSETQRWEGQTDPQLCGVGVRVGVCVGGQPGGPAPLSLNATATMHRLLLQPGGLELKQPT